MWIFENKFKSTNLNMKVPDSGQLLRSKEVRHCQEFRKRLFTR